MFLSIFCLTLSLLFILLNSIKSNFNNPNGKSIHYLQNIIGFIDFFINKFGLLSSILFLKTKGLDSNKIERVVWIRLLVVSLISVCFFYFYPYINKNISWLFYAICIYVSGLQISLIIVLLKPLFGIKLEDQKSFALAEKDRFENMINIPSPRRSLLLALINYFEIILSWGIIYKIILFKEITSISQANYFSIVTLTTLGYGDIAAKNNGLAQIAISINLIIFVLFSVCHITTILGTISNSKK